jgi:hypothetical protein
MGWEDAAPSEEVEVADWIRDRLHGFGEDVGSVVPTGFAGYARIFHPAVQQRHALDDPEVEIRWSEVAARTGKTVHPEMQFHTIAGHALNAPRSQLAGFYDPMLGVLSKRQCAALVDALSRHTSTPDHCWFGLWEGYGDLHPGSTYLQTARYVGSGLPRLFRILALKLRPPRDPVPFTKFPPQRRRVRLPGRDYFLFTGPVVVAQGWNEGPNLWWPHDKTWFVASEIDFPYTYVGGPKDAIDEILKHPAIEALPADMGDGIWATSDKVNS